MRRISVPLAGLALLMTALVPGAVAPTASGLILCEDCTAFDPPATRCFGTCQGQSFRYCGDWLAYGCPTTQFAPGASTGLLGEECDAVQATAAEVAPEELLLPEPTSAPHPLEPPLD